MKSPHNLCDKLGLSPTEKQTQTFARMSIALAEKQRTLDVSGDERNEAMRAVAIIALWRALSIQGALVMIVAAKKENAEMFMTFLHNVVKRCSSDLAQVSGFPRWNVLRFGGQSGWEIRVVPNNPVLVGERASSAVVSIILGAGETDPNFNEAARALEEGATHEKNTLIRVW